MFRTSTSWLLLLAWLAIAVGVASRGHADDAAARTEELFAQRILPLFKAKCFPCHGDDLADVRGEFNMLSRTGLLTGGESGEPAIIIGQAERSPLYRAVRWEGLEMPPKENDKLSGEQIAQLREWINGGAPWPDERRLVELMRTSNDRWNNRGGVTVSTSGGLADEWTNRQYQPEHLWAYQPLAKDVLGSLAGQAQDGKNPIDMLIERRLAELGLPVAPLASRRVLIRRATFDLTGLPPTLAEMADFEQDPSDDASAFAAVIERLLSSPHYGEQWGRHWLDVVRYADSAGYANDYERGNAWRYRDYVVRAFNDDKPYDQFIREQIAGDELLDRRNRSRESAVEPAAARPAGSAPLDSELLIAVGFLRMGPWELTGMEVAKVARQRFLDDVTDAVGQVFLGHMLQCARCHDHKFDPVPTRDYYSIQACFATTQLAERPAAFLSRENTAGFDERQYLEQRRDNYQQVLARLDDKNSLAAARAWYAERGLDPSAFEAAVEEVQRQRGKPAGRNPLDAVRNLLARKSVHPDLIPPRHVGFEPADFGLERVARKGLERLKWRFDRYEPWALSVYDGRTPELRAVTSPLRVPVGGDDAVGGELEQTAILVGGDPFAPAARVEPGVLSVVARRAALPGSALPGSALPAMETGVAGRRLALAEWIASPGNPLTARVMVNRIWQWHFGQAIAGNPNNFGTTGKKPTHPELLDWLAGRFMAQGWSVKAMHRQIMTSAAYRRAAQQAAAARLDVQHPPSARVPPGANDVRTLGDAMRLNHAMFRPRRLDAEELYDAMLALSGELNRATGGIPVRPEMNLEAALQPRQVMGTFAEAWQPSPRPEQRHRRAIYALRLRGQRDPFFEVFNAPSPELSCEAREASTVTPQVFAMFNSEITFGRALALAQRIVDECQPELKQVATTPRRLSPTAIERLFQLAFGRAATDKEVTRCREHWANMVARHQQLSFPRFEPPWEVVREAVEENTGEKFRFTEPLEFYRDFVPDLQPADVTAELRGLAEVCLVVLNANEFAYVY